MTILVTGGAGFIGANFIISWLNNVQENIVNIDKLTYAGNLANLDSLKNDSRYIFVQGDICDSELIKKLLKEHQPRAVLNFAAESHVDRSIYGPEQFIQTNVVGTFRLLDTVNQYWSALDSLQKNGFRFLQISTDEVYGSLDPNAPPFTEESRYEPNSPYSASKASSDHLVRAYYHTYGLPVLTTNCSNNYGPYQFPEKFIPLIIHNALSNMKIPVYGDGKNIRDWLYVQDHCSAIRRVLDAGRPGQVYNIGGLNEISNIDIAKILCGMLDEMRVKADGRSYLSLIGFVKDRPGHDRRYAIDASKIRKELGWQPVETFETGIRKTIKWYLENQDWVSNVTSGAYRDWLKLHYV